MKKIFVITLAILLLYTVSSPMKKIAHAANSISKVSPQNLQLTEQKLWIDHVLWTRNFIISDLASLGDKEVVAQRLLQNQDDIGNSIKPFYGDAAGNALAKLLREHITIATQVVDAAKSGDNASLEKYNKAWYENADAITIFLSKANPNWPANTVKDMLYTHLKLTTDEVVARLHNNWQGDVMVYDKGEDHMVMFAKMLADGILKQFPGAFN